MTSEANSSSQECTPGRQVAKEIDGFVGHLDSLSGILPALMGGMHAVSQDGRQALKQYEKDNAMLVEEHEGTRTVTLTAETFAPYKRLMKRHERASRATRLLPEIFIVALVSQYDAFLGGLVRALMTGRPEIASASNRTISFVQLVTFESVDAARDAIIAEEVDTLIRKSHVEQFSWLESMFTIKLREGLQQWHAFIELTERRNLFVHAGGVVSSQYLDVCRRHGVPIGAEVTLGSRLHVPQEYFDRGIRLARSRC